ncbi:MAG TPA: hypothetical protein PKC43_02800 [Phycisphaerales bacterium]|nr:hypothetical protein [Phycisphaerales bacterium]HMP36355.1 hypothetical protein [Phycisphaerales bacterium]
MAATVPSKIVRQLCTAAEAELVRLSRERGVKEVSPSQLRGKLERARALRDKFRDLAQRQRREARGKQAPRGASRAEGNDRTVLKQQIFAEAVENFERRIAAIEADGRAGKSAGTKSAKASKPAGRGDSVRSDRQRMRKALRIETKSTARPVAKKAGRGAAASADGAAETSTVRAGGTGGAGGKKDKSPPSKSAPATASGRTTTRKNARAALERTATMRKTGGRTSSIERAASSLAPPRGTGDLAVTLGAVEARNTSLRDVSFVAEQRKTSPFDRTGAVKHRAHIGAANRRRQAKRDARGA